MSNLLEYEGDLLQAQAEVIVHQCNCMSKNASGLAAFIFAEHPETNTYANNPDQSLYGTWKAFPVENKPYNYVLNLYTQLYPGSPGHGIDNAIHRLNAFTGAINSFIEHHQTLKSIAFPKFIGCGLAGGNWDMYRLVIRDLSIQFPHVTFHIIEKKK